MSRMRRSASSASRRHLTAPPRSSPSGPAWGHSGWWRSKHRWRAAGTPKQPRRIFPMRSSEISMRQRSVRLAVGAVLAGLFVPALVAAAGQAELSEVRAATARFHDVDAAIAAGYELGYVNGAGVR